MSHLTDPDELLGNLFASTFRGTKLDAFTRGWLQRGILSALRKDIPLDRALGLARTGHSSLQSRYLMTRRNHHLIEALEAVALDSTVTEWQRCTRLAPEVRKFMQQTWPHYKRLANPPDAWPAFKKHLWHAAATDHQLPDTASGLRRVLLSNGGFSRNKTSGTFLSQFL